jgi:tetratricopeptide (TPR) repeat protein
VKVAAALLVLLFATSIRAQSSPDDHLLTGAAYFRQERYLEALVEFRVAERGGSDGAAWYVGSALVKLKRPEEAIVVFARAEANAAPERDALLDYYHAVACHDAKLYGCADRLLAGLGAQAGPRIAALAGKIRADLAPLLSTPPAPVTIDWYQSRGAAAEKSGQLALAVGYYQETLRLAVRHAGRYRWSEASEALRRLQPVRKGPAPAAERTP